MLSQEASSSTLINAVAVFVLLVLAATHFEAAKEAYRQRIFVSKSFNDARRVAHLVEANHSKGKILDEGWRYVRESTSSAIVINTKSGVVTIFFPADIDGGNKTLTLVPLNTKTGAGISSSETVLFGMSVKKGDIEWLCLSSSIDSNRPYIYNNRGTLSGKYAPVSCRYISDRISKSIMNTSN
jgi:hypothetical protein